MNAGYLLCVCVIVCELRHVKDEYSYEERVMRDHGIYFNYLSKNTQNKWFNIEERKRNK